MNSLTIRAARHDDVGQILPLLQQRWAHLSIEQATIEPTFLALLESDGQFAFCVKKEIIAFATLFLRQSLWQAGKLALIGEFIVAENCRGAGVGQRLLEFLVDFAT